MLDILNRKSVDFTVTYTNANLYGRVKDLLNSNVKTVQSNERALPAAVRSDHLLIKLINSIVIPLKKDPYEMAILAEGYTDALARNLKLHNSGNLGYVYKGEFYGDGIAEYIMAIDHEWDVDSPWEEWEPVKVYAHHITSLTSVILDGRSSGFSKGFAVLNVNIPMLAVQYQQFMLKYGIPNQLGVQHFVRCFVIPNLLRSHLAVAAINRFLALYCGEDPIDGIIKKYHLMTVDVTNSFDAGAVSIIRAMYNKKLSWGELINNLPVMFGDDIWNTLAVPEMASTRQVKFAYTLSKLNLLNRFVEIDYISDSKRNVQHHNDVKIFFERLDNDKISDYPVKPSNLSLGDLYRSDIKPYL